MVVYNAPASLPPLDESIGLLPAEAGLAQLHYPPLPTSFNHVPAMKLQQAPDPRTHTPVVYPGGRVVWKEKGSEAPSAAAAANAGLRGGQHPLMPSSLPANLSNALGDHETVEMLSELMSEQQLPSAMEDPPKAPPAPSAMIMQIAGLEPSFSIEPMYRADVPMSRPSSKGGLDFRPRSRPSTPSMLTGMTLSASAGQLGLPAGLFGEPPLPAGSSVAVRRATKPSSREQVIKLESELRQRLHAASGRLAEQMAAWDAAFAEVARQVRVSCAERGDLLDAIRSRYDDWIARLLMSVAEMHAARERRTETAQEEANTQEERLQELLLANRSMAQKMQVGATAMKPPRLPTHKPRVPTAVRCLSGRLHGAVSRAPFGTSRRLRAQGRTHCVTLARCSAEPEGTKRNLAAEHSPPLCLASHLSSRRGPLPRLRRCSNASSSGTARRLLSSRSLTRESRGKGSRGRSPL